jgi:hypothetical protein
MSVSFDSIVTGSDIVDISIINRTDSTANIWIIINNIDIAVALDIVDSSIIKGIDSIANISIIVNGLDSIATVTLTVVYDIVDVSINRVHTLQTSVLLSMTQHCNWYC